MEDKIQEIFDHTSDKVKQISLRVIDEYNNQHSFRTDLTSPKYKKVISESIAFPIEY
jgi:hypothetical protein